MASDFYVICVTDHVISSAHHCVGHDELKKLIDEFGGKEGVDYILVSSPHTIAFAPNKHYLHKLKKQKIDADHWLHKKN